MLRVPVLLMAMAMAASGQTTGAATLRGAVTDSTGATVASAKVSATNSGTAFVYETLTGQDGSYYIPYVTPGEYRLTVEAPGFKRYVREGITLRTAEQPRIDIQLEVGSVTESLTVTAAAPLLETETAASGQILDGDMVVKIPVMQKFVHRVLLYMPGTTNINGQHINGQRQRAIGYTMDGVSGKEPVVGRFGEYREAVVASLDSIQEFKVWTTGMPAEFGHSSGGQMSVTFRSGSNQFHGSLEDRYTNGQLMHRHYFEPARRDGPFTYHEWGATAGGPIIRNKTFFFAGFQQHLEKLLEGFIGNVPSEAMMQGNFDFGSGTYPIFNPFTTRENGPGNWVRDPFPSNQIPASMIDPVARNLLALKPWRPANAPGILTPTGPQQNLSFTAPGHYDFKRYDIKIDHQFSSTHKIFGRYSQVQHRSEDRPVREIAEAFRFELWGNPYIEPADNVNIVVSDTYTIGPSMINEFRIGANRRAFTRQPGSFGQNWAEKLGIPNVAPDTFPNFNLYALNPGGKAQEIGEDLTIQENFTKVWSRHVVKAGYELVRTRYNSFSASLPSGSYNMGGTDFPFRPNTGNAFASFLLGTVSSAQFTQNFATWLPQWWQHAWYVQDSWKVRPNLSLELGLRWSYETPFETKYGQQTQFDPAVRDPLTGAMGAATHPQGPLARKDLNNFQPRFGLAWNFRPGTVFRGSFGVMTSDLFVNSRNQNFEEYAAAANIQGPPGDPRHAFVLSQGPPRFTYPVAADGSVPFIGSNYAGRSVSWYDPNMRSPYVLSWSAGVQQQLSTAWLVELQYTGSAGNKLLNTWNINQVPFDISSNFAELDRISRALQNYKPYTHFGNINLHSNFGHNTHHAGMLRVEKRMSSGLMLNAFYQLGKTLDNADDDGGAGGVDYYNRSLDKGRASYDIRHRFVSVMTYELPFGRGRRFMNAGGIKNYVFGGWDLAWTQTFQSGPPVTITHAGSPFRYLGGNRPDVALPYEQAVVDEWEIGPDRYPFSAQNRYFNFDAFAYPAAFTLGNAGRNAVEAPGMRWTQLSLSKEFPIGERVRFSIRWDLNNATKEPQFAGPNTAFNLTNRANFGTISGTRGSFSDIGTARMHHIIVGRFEF
jgi:hypothetical protein